MNAGNTESRWGWVAQALHWLMVLMVLGNMVIGKIAEEMGTSPDKLKLFLWHKSLGLTVLGLALLRLLWRWLQPTPTPPPGRPAWERWAAIGSHTLLYVLMIVMPLSGWALNSAANVPLRWFGWLSVPALMQPSEEWEELLEEVHETLFLVFLALVVLHAAAALKHHFVHRDTVLRRMLPGKTP